MPVLTGVLALLATAYTLASVQARFVVVVFGGALVFQSSSGIDATKVAYLAAVMLVLALTTSDGPTRLKGDSAAVFATLAFLSVVSIVRGNDGFTALRDASNYFMLCAAAPLAVHFGRRVSERALLRLGSWLAAFGVYAFAAEWTTRRGYGSLPSPGVPSTTLFAFAVSGAAAIALTRPQASSRWWAFVAGSIAAGLFTGTRNMVAMILAPLALVWWSTVRTTRSRTRRRARRASLAALLVVPIAVWSFTALARAAGVDVGAATTRVLTLAEFDSSYDLASSPSLRERSNQQEAAWNAFEDGGVLAGSGPGTVYEWQRWNGRQEHTFVLDSSLAVLAKWGVVGTAALIFLLWRWWGCLRPRRSDPNVWSLTVLGMIPVLAVQSLLAPIPEDRGLPLVLIVLGAGTLAHSRSAPARSDVLEGQLSSAVVHGS